MVETPVPVGFLKDQIHRAFMKVWNEEWKSTKIFRQTKIFFPELNPKQSEFLLLLGRKMLGLTISLKKGQKMLNYHRHVM